jgi:N utilization substance protein A
VREVQLNEEEGIATVIVHDQQLSLAIGKEGQNARLAARLTGWRIDIRSENEGEDEVVEEVWTEEGVVVDEVVTLVHEEHAHEHDPITEVFTDGVTLVEETLNVVTDDEGHQIRVVDEVVMDEDGTEIEVLEVDVTEGKA